MPTVLVELNEEFLLSRWGYLISTTSIALAALYSLGFLKFCMHIAPFGRTLKPPLSIRDLLVAPWIDTDLV